MAIDRCPSLLLEKIKKLFPEIPTKVAFQISHDLLYFPYKRNHDLWDGKAWSHRNINEKYGRNGAAFLEKTGLFHGTRWLKKSQLMRAFSLTEASKEILEEFHSDKAQSTVLELRRGKLRKSRQPKRPVERFSKLGHRAKNIEYLALDPCPDIESLKNSREELLGSLASVSNIKERAKIENNILQISGIVASSRSDHGTISTYMQSSTGRYSGQGAHLQNCSKSVCALALPGYCESDIENCHYRMIQQKALKLDFAHMPTLGRYLNDKPGWRKGIAEYCNIHQVVGQEFVDLVVSVKSSLVALAYGAHLSPVNTAISKEFGDYEIAKRFCFHPDVMELKKEIKIAARVIVDDARRNHVSSNGYAKNEAGVSVKTKDLSNERLLAFFLQGAESAIMQAAMPVVDQEIVVWKHDGILVKDFVTDTVIGKMTEAVEAATGYLMDFNSTKISA